MPLLAEAAVAVHAAIVVAEKAARPSDARVALRSLEAAEHACEDAHLAGQTRMKAALAQQANAALVEAYSVLSADAGKERRSPDICAGQLITEAIDTLFDTMDDVLNVLMPHRRYLPDEGPDRPLTDTPRRLPLARGCLVVVPWALRGRQIAAVDEDDGGSSLRVRRWAAESSSWMPYTNRVEAWHELPIHVPMPPQGGAPTMPPSDDALAQMRQLTKEKP
jgi:hypothetical protein